VTILKKDNMTLKEKLRNKKLSIGSWITIGDNAIAEIMSKAGFDWLAVDMEHSALSADQCQELVRVIDLCQIAPLVRVGANDPLLIKRAMDAGAHGVIVPMINFRQDAEMAVKAVKYPPQGSRGVGLSRAQGYGTSFHEYKKWLEAESVVIAQIEHIDGVNNLDEIIEVEGIDALMVGPYDLSGSLRIPGNFEDRKMLQALGKIQKLVFKKGIPLGYHVVSSDPKLVEKKIKEGYLFIAFGVDFLFLGDNCRSGLKVLNDDKNT